MVVHNAPLAQLNSVDHRLAPHAAAKIQLTATLVLYSQDSVRARTALEPLATLVSRAIGLSILATISMIK